MPESEAAAAGRACLDVAQQLVELDCAAIRYRHRGHQLDAAVCKIDRKIDSPSLGKASNGGSTTPLCAFGLLSNKSLESETAILGGVSRGSSAIPLPV